MGHLTKRKVTCAVLALALLAIAGVAGCQGLAPDPAKEHFNRGVTLKEQGKYDEAIAEYDQAIALNPQYAAAYSNRGYAYLQKKQYGPAVADFTRAIALDPTQKITFNNRGVAYHALKEYDRAALDFEQALKLDPNFAQAAANRLLAANLLNQASLFNRQGVDLAGAGKNNEAFQAFSRAFDVFPHYPSALTNRGIIYLIEKQYDPALKVFDSALKVKADYAPTLRHRGLVYIHLGRYAEAVADLDQALKLDPDQPLDWNNRGVALEQLGEADPAIVSYNRALKLDPANTGIQSNLAGALKRAGKPGLENRYIRHYGTRYEKAWEGTTDVPEPTPGPTPKPTPPPDGGNGAMTGTWVNNGDGFGLVMSDGMNKWNYDVVMKINETDTNTGGLHVHQPCTFRGTLQMTLKSIFGQAARESAYRDEIGKTLEIPVSGTREQSLVMLNWGARSLRLTYDGNWLYGNPTFFDQGTQLNWTYVFNLKRQ